MFDWEEDNFSFEDSDRFEEVVRTKDFLQKSIIQLLKIRFQGLHLFLDK